MKPKVVIITGPTAVGKTDISVEVAKALNGEIVSADSMQIYKYMNIGSAKPTKEEMQDIPHYLVDEIEPDASFSVSDYQKMAFNYIDQIIAKGKTPVITGGTGLYVNALLYKMDFSSTSSDQSIRNKYQKLADEKGSEYIHNLLFDISQELGDRIHPNNTKKIIRALEVYETTGEVMRAFEESLIPNNDYDFLLFGLDRDREELYERINKRVDILIDLGLVEEVQQLLDQGLSEDNISMKGIGYKEIISYLHEEYDLEDAIFFVKRNTRRYAKRQLTWFRKYNQMIWIKLSKNRLKDTAINDILSYIHKNKGENSQ